MDEKLKQFLIKCQEIMMHAPGGHGYEIDVLGSVIENGILPDYYEEDEE